MKVIIAGSSGMIGKMVLNHCLGSTKVSEVRSLVRKTSGLSHPKLVEIVISNFEDYSQFENIFKEINVAFFCLGVYTGQVSDEEFKKITVDYAVRFASAVEKNSPGARFCLLSGAGSDRTEKSNVSFARYKGMAENQIASLHLQFFSVRPAYIYSVEQRKEPNMAYNIMKYLYPIIKLFGTKYSITSTDLSLALFNVGMKGADHEILENHDILRYRG